MQKRFKVANGAEEVMPNEAYAVLTGVQADKVDSARSTYRKATQI